MGHTEIRLTLSLPPTLNHMYRHVGRHHYKTATCTNWEVETQRIAKQARPVLIPKGTGVAMEVNLFLKFDRDIDSSTKALQDCLEGILYENDSQITEMTIRKQKDPKNPRLEVVIKAVEASLAELGVSAQFHQAHAKGA